MFMGAFVLDALALVSDAEPYGLAFNSALTTTMTSRNLNATLPICVHKRLDKIASVAKAFDLSYIYPICLIYKLG